MTIRLLFPLALLALLAACAGPSTTVTRAPAPTSLEPVPDAVPDAEPTDGRCNTCGVVERIERTAAAPTAQQGESTQGGIVGGVLGNDDGKPAAAGFSITVKLDSGQVVTVKQRALGGVRQGQRVEIVDGRAQPVLTNPAAE